MNKILVRLSLFLLVILTAAAAVSAQSPDPTGRGRYTVIGPVTSQAGAVMATQLPPGASCGPVGELLGQRVRNSTGNGVANTVELSSNAEIAVAPNGDVYLCHCGMSGKLFNRLFIPEEQATEGSTSFVAGGAQQQQQQIVVQPSTASVNVAAPIVKPQINVAPSTAQVVVINKCDVWCKLNAVSNTVNAAANVAQAFGTFKIAKAINNIKMPTGGTRPPIVQTLPPGPTVNTTTTGFSNAFASVAPSGGFSNTFASSSFPSVTTGTGQSFVWR